MALEVLLVVQSASHLERLILYLTTKFVHVYTEKSNRALCSSYEYVHVCIHNSLWVGIFIVDPPLPLASCLVYILVLLPGPVRLVWLCEICAVQLCVVATPTEVSCNLNFENLLIANCEFLFSS